MKKMDKFLFTLHEKPPSRKVYVGDNGVYVIKSKNSNDKFMRAYNRFVTERTDMGFISNLRDKFNNIQASSFSTKPNFLAKLLSAIATPTPKIAKYGSMLDVGCSTGIFLHHLSKKWKLKKGIDINKSAWTLAREKGLEVSNVTLEKYKTSEKFDYIRASHVIEHVTDYDLFLKKTYSLLNKNGRLIIYTPNSNSLTKRAFGEFWEGFYDSTHFTIFNLKNLENHARSRGFKTVSKTTYDMGYWPASLIRMLNLADTKVGNILFWIFLGIFHPIGVFYRNSYLGDALYIELKKV